jgi:hypothetical protein
MTCKRFAFFLACGAVCLLTGCRCTVAVSFGGDAVAEMEAGKLYDDVDLSPELSIPLIP